MAWDSNLDDNQELLRAVRAAWDERPRRCPVYNPAACPTRPKPDLACEGEAPAGGGSAGSGGSSAPPTPAGCAQTYAVKAGDTCWAIWTANALTDQQFYAINPGLNCNALVVGGLVCVKGAGGGSAGSGGTAPPTPAGCVQTYTVKAGDTCWAIWTANSLTEQQFYATNPGLNCNALAIGSPVCVKATG